GPAPWVWKQVVMTTGSHHMQVYWVEGDDDRKLHAFPFSFLRGEAAQPGRWVPNETTLLRPPVEDGVYTWNYVCIKCHAVAGAPRIEDGAVAGSDGARADTQVAELGIACEACHGPGQEHVRRHQNPITRYAKHMSEGPDPTIVHPGKLDAARSSAVCGQCHAITRFADELGWHDGGSTFAPGEPLAPVIRVVRHPLNEVQTWLDEEVAEDPDFFVKRFWPDGMVRISGREYNGLIESPCASGGEFSCLSCHSMHQGPPDDQLDPKIDADTSCLQCHGSMAQEIAAHTHHEAESSGSMCINCHMPHTSYGLLKAIRSHQIDSPNLAASLPSGRPGACNLCHLDRTLEWTGDWLHRWYGQELPDLEPDEREIAAGILWLLRGDAGVRALVAWHFSWAPAVAISGNDWMAPFLKVALVDEYVAVRHIAGKSLAKLPDVGKIDYDALADTPRLEAVAEQVASTWSNHPTERCVPEFLLTDTCDLDSPAVDRILGERPGYPVILEE
ncbi:MAG: cytochrome c3 family protein, partial [Nannocystaceae bacterium]